MAHRILFVDDDDHLRGLMVPTLELAGFDVVEQTKLQLALFELKRQRFDLAVIDGLLPDGQGQTVVEQIHQQNLGIPVIFISSFWRDAASQQRLLRETGVTAFLGKPFYPDQLVDKVCEVLGVEGPGQSDEELTADSWWTEDPDEPAAGASPVDEDTMNELERRLAELREGYAERLMERLVTLRTLVAVLGEAEDPRELAQEVRVLAHKIRGSSGSYGFDTVGGLAGEIEEALNDWFDRESPAEPDLWQHLQEVAGALDTARLKDAEDPSREM